MSVIQETELYEIKISCEECKTEGKLQTKIYKGRWLKKTHTIFGPFGFKDENTIVCKNCKKIIYMKGHKKVTPND